MPRQARLDSPGTLHHVLIRGSGGRNILLGDEDRENVLSRVREITLMFLGNVPQNMALRIEKAFGLKMDTLLRMHTAYDIAEARDREAEIKVKRYAGKRPAVHGQATL